MAAEMDPVNAMKTEEPLVRVKGIPIACHCGASVMLATSNEHLTRGHRYFCCGYDLSDGRGHGCGFKKWLESSVLEEFKEMKRERTNLEQYVEEVNMRIDDLQLKYEEMIEDEENLDAKIELVLKVQELELQYEKLEAQYGQLQSKYELMQHEIRSLKRNS